MNTANNKNREMFSTINLKELKKGQIIRLIFFDLQKKETVFQGQIIRIHKAGKDSTLSLKRKMKGIYIQIVFPIYAPFIIGIQIIQQKFDFLKVEEEEDNTENE